jgi:hypothetical protein
MNSHFEGRLIAWTGYGESLVPTMVTVLEALSVGVAFRVADTEIVGGFGILAGAV